MEQVERVLGAGELHVDHGLSRMAIAFVHQHLKDAPDRASVT